MEGKQAKKSVFLDPNEISNLFKLNHIQLDVVLKRLKQKIDKQFQQFSTTLITLLNNLNYIRYHQTYPSDDFKFIFKERVNASLAENRLDQKEEIMRRMSQFSLIKLDVGGINDNCIWEIQSIIQTTRKTLNFQELCPSGATFLQRHQQTSKEYLQFWKANQGGETNMGNIFKDMSPVFSRQQIKKIGSIFSQQNKKIISTNLLFRGSQHNFQSALFKQTCSGKAPTLMIAKSDKGKIFGGFTPAKWLNTKQKQYVGDPTATSFLFSLDNNLVFPIKKNQLDYAISAYGGWGPIYGSPYGPDLSISDKCHMNDTSCSSLGSHYDIPINVKEYSVEAFSLLAGAKKFKIVEYEVYEVKLE